MQAVTFGLLCLVLMAAAGANVCTFDGVFFDGSCYSFVNDTANWFEALAVCTASNGYLAQVESQDERDWLKSELIARKSGPVWIGGADLFRKGVWRWMSNGHVIGPFTDWAEGQPSGYAPGATEVEERCLEMRRDSNFLWNDAACTHRLWFVCEMKFF